MPERRMSEDGGVVTMGHIEVMRVGVMVELNTGSVLLTLLQVLQHIRQ